MWLRLGLVVAVVGSLSWLVYLYFGGNGTLVWEYHFNGTSEAISQFQPHGRALDLEKNQDNGETYQRLVGEPAYFTVTLPGAYDRIEVALEYQNDYQTVVELGVKQSTDPAVFDYLMQPLENKLVDDSDWYRLENDDYILLQRQSVYASVEDFLVVPPLDTYVGTYLNVPTPQFVDPTYQADPTTGSDLQVTLRGPHEFYSYAAVGEAITFTANLANINYVVGDDPITLTLYQDDTVIASADLLNNGQANLAATAPVTGVYRLVLDCSDDVLITRLESSQERLVVGKHIHLAGSEEYVHTGVQLNTAPTTLTSDANWLTFIAKHPYGVGDYLMYDGAFPINKVDTPYTWENPIANYSFSLTVPRNDLYMESDSYFALPGATEFDPWFGFRPISRFTYTQGLDYVLSEKYTEPSRLRGWTTASAAFDLTSVTQQRPNQLQFLLSAPGLESVPTGLKVRNITITAQQPALTFSYLWEKLFGAN